MSIVRLFGLWVPVVALVACVAGEEPDEEEERATTSAAAGCPSPIEDPDAFQACVKAKSGTARADAKGGSGNRSNGGNAGNGGRESSSANGGSIRLGDVDAKNCSNLTIRCENGGCTCSANGGPLRSCNGNDCVAVCCGK